MSAKATIWAWKQAEALPSTSVLVTLLALADGARDNGKVWQSNNYLAAKTHQSTRAITNALKALADPDGLNLIQIENGASFYRTIRLNFSPVIIFPDGPEPDDDAKHLVLGRKFHDLEPLSKDSARGSRPSAPRANKPKDITQVKNHAPNGAQDAGAIDEEEDFSASAPKVALPALPPKPPKPTFPKDDPDAFSVFWAVYPKRQGRAAALGAWPTALAKIKGEERPGTYLITKAQELADNLGDEAHFAPTPERWLRQERWDDELPPRPKPSSPALDRRRAENDERLGDMLAGGLDALNRRRGLAGGGPADRDDA